MTDDIDYNSIIADYADGCSYLQDKIDELEREIDRLNAAQTWQQIETAPRDGTKALWWVEFGPDDGGLRDVVGYVVGHWEENAARGYCLKVNDHGDSWHRRGVRAWMPLPQPPKINPTGHPCDKRV